MKSLIEPKTERNIFTITCYISVFLNDDLIKEDNTHFNTKLHFNHNQ